MNFTEKLERFIGLLGWEFNSKFSVAVPGHFLSKVLVNLPCILQLIPFGDNLDCILFTTMLFRSRVL